MSKPYWWDYHAEGWSARFPPGARVLDIGCGSGGHMLQLRDAGCDVEGVERDPELVEICRTNGLNVHAGKAEQLPFGNGSFDGVYCNVVVPYTEERKAVEEMARVLRPGGKCFLVCHGAGFSARYVLAGPSWKLRLYGLRTLVNTWWYALTGTRLYGFIGDTLYQSRRRLERYYRMGGLSLVAEPESKSFLGWPVFIHHELVRRPQVAD